MKMISNQQCKNVITYYFLDMMKKEEDGASSQIPSHITRDTIFFNKMRANVCGSIYNTNQYKDILSIVHNSSSIKQINTVPRNSICEVDKKPIPLSQCGVQLICKQVSDDIKHVVVRKEFQQICNSYFKLRYFPEHIQHSLTNWLIQQPWYLPNCYKTNKLLQKILTSTFPTIIFNDLTFIVESLESR